MQQEKISTRHSTITPIISALEENQKNYFIYLDKFTALQEQLVEAEEALRNCLADKKKLLTQAI